MLESLLEQGKTFEEFKAPNMDFKENDDVNLEIFSQKRSVHTLVSVSWLSRLSKIRGQFGDNLDELFNNTKMPLFDFQKVAKLF